MGQDLGNIGTFFKDNAEAISIGAQGVGTILEYRKQVQADKLAKDEAFTQARLLQQDADRKAQEELLLADQAKKRQKTLFLKSGVTLEGSPLLLMEETRAKGAENAKNIKEGAKTRADLLKRQGSVQRASLFGSLSDFAVGATQTHLNQKILKKQTELSKKQLV